MAFVPSSPFNNITKPNRQHGICHTNTSIYKSTIIRTSQSFRTTLMVADDSTSTSTSSAAVSVTSLKSSLRDALEGLNLGLLIDADSETMDDQESAVEDLIEQIENMNDCELPTRDIRMNGEWNMLYTSSTISRYFGGLTGMQKYIPDGSVESIHQKIDTEDGTCSFSEVLECDVPFIDKRMRINTEVSGKLRVINDTRLKWDAENVKISFWKRFAEGWKTVRAFKVTDVTYLDDDFRIIRGQTGSVCVFEKFEDGKQK